MGKDVNGINGVLLSISSSDDLFRIRRLVKSHKKSVISETRNEASQRILREFKDPFPYGAHIGGRLNS